MGIDDYTKARKIAEKEFRQDVAEGRYPFLPALDEMVRERKKLSEKRIGSIEIPISLIRGTVTKGRQEAFTRNFMPLLPDGSEFSQKWISLLNYQEAQGITDPVKVYEFLGRFYVLEGNKRVSVMKYLGNPGIPAEVIRILPEDIESEEIGAYREFLRFFSCTGQYEPMLSEKGAYERLAEIFGEGLQEKWDRKAIQNLRSAFFRFSGEYREIGGEDLRIPAGDAFMLFLDVYGRDALCGAAEDELRKRIKKLWMEYRVKSNRDPIAFVRLPNARRPRIPLRGIITKGAVRPFSPGLKAAFIYDGDPGSSRWLNGHENGRRYMEEKMQGRVRTRSFQGCVTAEQFDSAVDSAIADGARLIFTTSPAQMKDTLRAAVLHPEVNFLNCSVNMSHNAVRTYYGRMYEVKFLLGVLAAALSKDHRISYVCGAPLYGTLANINAFAIGAAMIDPEIRIRLIWSCLEGRDWRTEVREEGTDIVSGPDMIHPGKEDREYGLYRYEQDGSAVMLANPEWKWGRFYELIARSVMSGYWRQEAGSARDQALNYWWGLSSGVIGVEVSEEVPASTRHLVEGLKKAMVAGLIGPFEGELMTQNGRVEADCHEERIGERSRLKKVISAGKRAVSMNFFEERSEPDVGLTPEEIVTMKWLHECVEGRLPGWNELTLTAQKAVRADGILTTVE